MGKFHKLSYLAGLLDGEGYIVWKQPSDCITPVLHIIVEMTDENVIDWLLTFGGSKYSLAPRKVTRKETWRWTITGRKAELLYMQVKPLMMIKGNVKP